MISPRIMGQCSVRGISQGRSLNTTRDKIVNRMLYLGVGADVCLVARVGDAARDVHEAFRVHVLLLPRRQPVHAAWRRKKGYLLPTDSRVERRLRKEPKKTCPSPR